MGRALRPGRPRRGGRIVRRPRRRPHRAGGRRWPAPDRRRWGGRGRDSAAGRPGPAPAAGDGRRTIVVGGAVEGEIPPPDVKAPHERRTIVIGGHPNGVPYVRPPRPSRTAADRVGARPDRFVAYAVALGFLLILIAVLS